MNKWKVTASNSLAEGILMKKATGITCAFLDVGDVLLTDGWDHLARKRAAKYFKLEWADMEARHQLTFEVFEVGRLTLEEYLNLVVFYKKRSFTHNQFRQFMFAQSKPFPEMIDLVIELKQNLGLKIVIVSNESREVNAFRSRKFGLDKLSDCFVSSGFVHMRKPDVKIFRLALDLAQVRPEEVVFIDNTPMFVHIAEGLRIHGIVHEDYNSTRIKMSQLGINIK
jgi:putative hydrolase of the HAD superfamily